ncbi:DUF2141 domain-containing protein [Spongiimicrobium salis]|uniref:DUF2141 domain-containing protein n=1 Tax=Spongiimicrobium salis TaxID=1667022 RepID=UPI00374D14D6
MKTLGLFLSILFTGFMATAQDTTGNDIKVVIDNVLSDEGKVIVSLHNDTTFMKGAGIQNLESTIKDGKVTFTFKNVPPGTYAIMAMHDVNENNRMDFEANGMPKESYGMSGNAMSMGPPTFEDAKFTLADKEMEFIIKF